jgi:hypothetical protein
MKLIIEDVLVEEPELKMLKKTPAGCLIVEGATRSAVVSYTGDSVIHYIQNELKALSRKLTYDEIQSINSIIHNCLFKRKEADLDKYIEEVARALEEKEGPNN